MSKPRKRTRLPLIGLLCLCLLIFSGCSAARMVTRAQAVKLAPPAALLLEVPEPRLAGDTNGALLNYALELIAALREANADKAALREWAAQEARLRR